MIIGMGIDIQEIRRLEKALARSGEAFVRRAFSPDEISYCRSQKNAAQHFTGRFCAKEAFFKALGTGWARGAAWHEVEVMRGAAGAPALRLSGKTAHLAAEAGVIKIWLSLSHSEAYAAASVLLEG